MTSVYKRDTEGCEVPPLDIRVQAMRFSHIIQALRSHNIHVFCYSPLYKHEDGPLAFSGLG